MKPIPRPCLDCGRLHSNQSRCDPHQQAAKPPTHPAYNDPKYKRIRAVRIKEHVARHGWWCPGFEVEAHPASDLTLDHTVALSAGGTNYPSNLEDVLCRSCNTRKGGTNRTHRGGEPPSPA